MCGIKGRLSGDMLRPENGGRVGVDWKGFCAVGKEEVGTGGHPANPKNIKPEMKPFF